MNPEPLPPLHVPDLLKRFDLRPRKSLGQNFLADEHALAKVVATADLSPDDLVLEVGPGLGSLTRHLARRARRVVAVELDQNLLPPLREVLRPYPNVRLVHGDILEQDLQALLTNDGGEEIPSSYAVVANIPYYITSVLIRHLLEAPLKPDRIVLTVQKEVAMRICADPPDMSLLALGVQVYGQPYIEARLPAGAFYPVPKVDSAVLLIDVYPTPLIPPPYTEAFFTLAKAGFSQKRKNLRNALSGGLALPKDTVETLLAQAYIDPRRRAETLSLSEWSILAEHYLNPTLPPD
jgi:16S rRNA (adenine1518-N6/adenine1519-N6)-dimethyltransferase